MEPLKFDPPWRPDELGEPASSGGENGTRYAFFPQTCRPLVEEEGKKTVYDRADHQISRVQQSGQTSSLIFPSQSGAWSSTP